MVQLSATRCSCIVILWVSLASFAAITLYVASRRVIPKVGLYFVIDSARKLLDTPSYLIVCAKSFITCRSGAVYSGTEILVFVPNTFPSKFPICPFRFFASWCETGSRVVLTSRTLYQTSDGRIAWWWRDDEWSVFAFPSRLYFHTLWSRQGLWDGRSM
jgi:hypothetical protein